MLEEVNQNFGLGSRARLLAIAVRFKPQADETLCNAKHFLNIRERGRSIVVVIHQPVFVIPVPGDFIDHEARFL